MSNFSTFTCYNHQKTTQQGRSMAEIMGVLAVIGVLSVGGIMGYNMSSRKHHSNEIITGTNQRAIITAQQLALDKPLEDISFDDLPTNAGKNTYFPKSPIPKGDDFFGIPVTGLDRATCEQIKVMAGGTIRQVDCQEGTGDSYIADIIYHKDLSQTAGIPPEGNTENFGGTGNSSTRIFDGNQAGCESANFQYCANETCITKEELCPTGSANCHQFPKTSDNGTGGVAGITDEGITCRCPEKKVYIADTQKCIPACSGHGTLTPREECICQTGYTGSVCETEIICSYTGTGIANSTIDNITYSGESAGLASDGITKCRCPEGYAWAENACKIRAGAKCANQSECRENGECQKSYFEKEGECIYCGDGVKECKDGVITECDINYCLVSGECKEFSNCQKCENQKIEPLTDNIQCDFNNDGDSSDGYCKSGVCEEKIEGKFCTSNTDCNSGSESGDYFCMIMYNKSKKINCSYTVGGECRPKGILPEKKIVNGIPTYRFSKAYIKDFMGSETYINQFTSMNLCKAHGKKIFDVEELGCYHLGITPFRSGDSLDTTYEHPNDGGVGTECHARGKRRGYGPTITDMAAKHGSYWHPMWTGSLLGDCDGYVIYLNSKRVGNGANNRLANADDILCHDEHYEVDECDLGYYKSNHQCAYCGDGVERCEGPNHALVCYEGYELSQGLCVQNT